MKAGKEKLVASEYMSNNFINTEAIWYKNSFYISIFLISIFRLWITSDVRLIAIPSTSDDFHYVINAYHYKMGKWLGPLDNWTLLTLPFFSIYLAFLSKLKISLIFSNHLLYVLSWIFGVFTLKHFIKKDWILIFTFILVLFNPMFYGGDVSRVVREGMWVPCSTFILFCYIRMVFIEQKFYLKFIYSFLIGLLVSAFYLTREDGILILPIMFFFIACYVFINFKTFKINWLKSSLLFLLPFIILKLSMIYIVSLNNKYYKADFLYENQMKELNEFMTLINSLEQNKLIERISLTYENRLKLIKYSPTFGNLKYMEPVFAGWSDKEGKYKNESVHFTTALKGVLYYDGYYNYNYSAVKQFYVNVTNELKDLINRGIFKIKKPHEMQKYLPAIFDLNKINLSDIFSKIVKCFSLMITLDDFKLLDSHEFGQYTYGNEQTIAIFKEVTNCELAYTEQEATPEVKEAYKNTLKNKILQTNYNFYKLFIPTLFLISFCGFIFLMLSKKIFQFYPYLIYCILAILLFVAIRVLVLSLVCSNADICLFSLKYFSLCFPYVFAFTAISIGLTIEILFSKINKSIPKQ